MAYQEDVRRDPGQEGEEIALFSRYDLHPPVLCLTPGISVLSMAGRAVYNSSLSLSTLLDVIPEANKPDGWLHLHLIPYLTTKGTVWDRG